MTSKPIAAIAGRRAAASAKVPLCLGTRPAERGNNSYQAAYRARTRSTTTDSSEA